MQVTLVSQNSVFLVLYILKCRWDVNLCFTHIINMETNAIHTNFWRQTSSGLGEMAWVRLSQMSLNCMWNLGHDIHFNNAFQKKCAQGYYTKCKCDMLYSQNLLFWLPSRVHLRMAYYWNQQDISWNRFATLRSVDSITRLRWGWASGFFGPCKGGGLRPHSSSIAAVFPFWPLKWR